jgi:general stress protein 26
VNRREQIRMAPEELGAFLEEQRTIICATIGRDGFPHLMPLWYVLRGNAPSSKVELWSWTFARSQKVRNLERDPRATLQVEAGTEYHDLRGVMLKADVTIHRDTPLVAELGLELFRRHVPEDAGASSSKPQITAEVRVMVLAQAPKRVALQFTERSRASWDHRKLAAHVH